LENSSPTPISGPINWRQGVYRRLQTKQTTTAFRTEGGGRDAGGDVVALLVNEVGEGEFIAPQADCRFMAHGGGNASRTWL